MRCKISRRLLNEAIEWYLSNFPDEHRVRHVGLEKEYPVVSLQTYEAADARQLFGSLQNFGWQPVFDDFYKQELVGVRKDGVEITTDAGWCTLEIIMPPEESIIIAEGKIREVERLVSKLCQQQNILLLGYGIQPITSSDSCLWIKKRRHEVIREGLPRGVNSVTITAADQVHVEITREEVVDAVNIFNALSGPIINLFANSPFWKGQLDKRGRLAVREDLWSFVGKKAGMPSRRFANLEDLISEMFSLRFSIVKSESKKDYFVPRVSFAEWASNNYDWRNQWKFHEGSIWWDVRPRTIYGTIEVRQVCSSVYNGCLAALAVGLLENLDQARALIEELPWQHWHILKSCAIYGLSNNTLQRVTERMLEISQDGLEKRSNESILLEPLWKRVNSSSNPAKEAIKNLETGGLPAFVHNCTIDVG